jgi:hypothetical protein
MGLKIQQMYRMCGSAVRYCAQPAILLIMGGWDSDMNGVTALIDVSGSKMWVLARKLEV